MAGQHHRCNEHELGQTLGDGEGQGGLACSSPWGRKESDVTGRLNNNSSCRSHILPNQFIRNKGDIQVETHVKVDVSKAADAKLDMFEGLEKNMQQA